MKSVLLLQVNEVGCEMRRYGAAYVQGRWLNEISAWRMGISGSVYALKPDLHAALVGQAAPNHREQQVIRGTGNQESEN